jgi:HlyD family secretion protein
VARPLACLLLAGLLQGCPSTGESPQGGYLTAAVEVAPLVDSVLATGRVQTVASVDVSSQISGQIEAVFVDYNDIVSKGQPLARLDPLSFQSRVDELDAALKVAQADLHANDAALAGARARAEEDAQEYERRARLEGQGSISQSEVSRARAVKLQSESELNTLAAARDVKLAHIAAASALLRQAQIDLERTVIRAPIAGVVIKRSIEPGQTVAVSLSAPELFTIADDLDQIQVHARVDEADVGRVAQGQRATFTVDAFPGSTFSGTVAQIRKAPEINQNVVSYTVVIEAANPGGAMLPGMTALVEIVTSEREKVLRVPNAALQFRMARPASAAPPAANGPGVWVAAPGDDYRHLSLRTGYSNGEFTEVLGGDLREGDRVVVGYRR